MNIRRMLKLTSVFAVSAALVFAQGNGRHTGAANAKGLGGFGLSSTQLERLAEFLGLTGQQLNDAQAILDQARADEEKLTTNTGDLQKQIQDLIKSSTGDFDAGIQALITSYTAAEAQELAIRLKAENRFWNLLTPEQKQKADELDRFLKPPAGNSDTAGGEKGNNGKANGRGNGNGNGK